MAISRMGDNSEFTLQWDTINFATLVTGTVQSVVFDKEGFKWTPAINRVSDNAEFTLRCDPDHDEPFICEVNVAMNMHAASIVLPFLPCPHLSVPSLSKHLCFDRNNSDLSIAIVNWDNLTNTEAVLALFCLTFFFALLEDTETRYMLISISRLSVKRGKWIVDATKFTTPNRMSNVILSIEGMKLHVCKELLAAQSPVFQSLFFEKFAEKGKEEVELKEVAYEEFVDLLHVIYVDGAQITDYSVHHILKLADRFQMEGVLNLAKKHLKQSNGIDVVKKLMIADKYNLIGLRDTCLKSFTSVAEIVSKIKSSHDYDKHYSSDMKLAICDRIMKI